VRLCRCILCILPSRCNLLWPRHVLNICRAAASNVKKFKVEIQNTIFNFVNKLYIMSGKKLSKVSAHAEPQTEPTLR
jgi:hypothetical protein